MLCFINVYRLLTFINLDKLQYTKLSMHFNMLNVIQAEFKAATGTDWQPAGGAAKKPEKQKKAAKEVKPKEKVDQE